MKDISFRIRHARQKNLLSQSALASQIGVNRSAVAQWERRGGARPTSSNLGKLAVATAISYEWLATGRGRMTFDGDGEADGGALVLQFYAHDEVEERVLIALRKLEYWQSVTIAEMVESLARGKLDA